MLLEALIIEFNGEDNITVPFNKKHEETPIITVMPQPATGYWTVNVAIRNPSVSGCELYTSEKFTGKVHLQAWSNE